MIDTAGLQADLSEAIADAPQTVNIEHAYDGGVSSIDAGVSDFSDAGRLIETEGEVISIDVSFTFRASAISTPIETGDVITHDGKDYTVIRVLRDRHGISVTADCKAVT